MHLNLKFDTNGLDWEVAAKVYEQAGFAPREPKAVQADFEAAKEVCFAFDMEKLVGLARVADGESGLEIRDMAMVPYAAGFDIGRVMVEYLVKRAGEAVLVPGGDAEREFLTKCELDCFM